MRYLLGLFIVFYFGVVNGQSNILIDTSYESHSKYNYILQGMTEDFYILSNQDYDKYYDESIPYAERRLIPFRYKPFQLVYGHINEDYRSPLDLAYVQINSTKLYFAIPVTRYSLTKEEVLSGGIVVPSLWYNKESKFIVGFYKNHWLIHQQEYNGVTDDEIGKNIEEADMIIITVINSYNEYLKMEVHF